MEEERFKFIAGSRMAKGVGGDYYTIKKFSESKWVISLCDVSGKGVSAALVTSLLGGLFSIYNFNSGLTEFIKKMNEYVLNSFNMEKYLTGVFMKFDEETGKVKLFDMGHSFIYVYRDKGLYKFKTSDDNVPIGFIPEISPKGNQFTLKAGDILFAVTDGITEQTDSEGNEYGMSKILSIIEKNKNDNFENIISEMQKDIDNFRGYHPQHDDMTMLVLQYKG
jgi:sigma-B regulation protein RsbU (phosphoserine phosphatase)